MPNVPQGSTCQTVHTMCYVKRVHVIFSPLCLKDINVFTSVPNSCW